MKVIVGRSLTQRNDECAHENRRRLDQVSALCVNLMSGPGSGKTTLLQKTLAALRDDAPCAVLVGDLQTTRDAERLEGLGAQVVQINTGEGCHLTAAQVAAGLDALDLGGVRYVFVENVGNLVCPAAFDLGEHLRVALLSVPEGDDKVAKYPTMFQSAQMALLTKVDLLRVLPFDVEQVKSDLDQVNSSIIFHELSAATGAGMAEWLGWLREQRENR